MNALQFSAVCQRALARTQQANLQAYLHTNRLTFMLNVKQAGPA